LSSHSASAAGPENLRASGRITVDRFTLPPLALSHLQGNLDLAGRRIVLRDAAGQFYGGQVSGSVEANLLAVPTYKANFDFARVDLAGLAAEFPNLRGVSSGTAAGSISLAASGALRADLIDSLSCDGNASIADAEWHNTRETGPATEPKTPSITLRYPDVSADFSCNQRKIKIENLSLQAADAVTRGSGTIDFSGALDLRFKPASAGAAAFYLTGTLAEPQLAPVSSASPRRTR